MADNGQFKYTRQQIERNEALKAQKIAKKQTEEKLKDGAKYVRGPLRSIILKK